VILFGAAIHPPHGLGMQICSIRATTGAPCPGCGLTRSMSCVLHGMFRVGWEYHPFGMAFLSCFVGLALVSLLPSSVRERLTSWTQRHTRWISFAYVVFIATFLTHGVVRALLHYRLN
jgi:hypothetical protein